MQKRSTIGGETKRRRFRSKFCKNSSYVGKVLEVVEDPYKKSAMDCKDQCYRLSVKITFYVFFSSQTFNFSFHLGGDDKIKITRKPKGGPLCEKNIFFLLQKLSPISSKIVPNDYIYHVSPCIAHARSVHAILRAQSVRGASLGLRPP